MSLRSFDPAWQMEARMRYLASGGDPRFLNPMDQAVVSEMKEFREMMAEAFMNTDMKPLVTEPPRIIPELDLPKPEYLHTIKLATPKVVKPTAVGTTYKAAKP